MKKCALFPFLPFLLILQSINPGAFSQNVGIGTTSPVEKLEVKNPLRSTLKISSGSFNDTTELLLSNRTISNQGTDFSIKSIKETGLFFSSLSDLSTNASSNSLIIRPNGNIGLGVVAPANKLEVLGNSFFNGNVGVGVAATSNKFEVLGNSFFNGFVGLGTSTPSVRLEIAGAIKLQGTNAFEFGSGIAGKEINGGKLGYQIFTADALDIVGAGTNNTNRKVKLWAEGGTTLAGPLSIGGTLQINGDPGTAGQVLTSNGTGAPQWKNSSFINTTRFAAGIPLFDLGVPITYTTIYNLNPADVTIGSSGITINKTGLYHFEGYLETQTNFLGSTPPDYFYISVSFEADAILFPAESGHQPEKITGVGNPLYYSLSRFSQDVYVTAPATVRLNFNYGINGGSIHVSSNEGKLTGYLISE